MRGRPGSKSRDHLDAVLELVVEDHQRVLEALRDIDVLHRGLVEIGVGLDRADDVGDRLRRSAGSRRSAAARRAARRATAAPESRCGGAKAVGDRRRAARPSSRRPPSPARCPRASATPSVLEPVDQPRLLAPRSRRRCRAIGRSPRCCASSVVESLRARLRSARAASSSTVRLAPGLERLAQVAAAALDRGRRIVEFVREPGRQRAERGELVALHQRGLGAAQPRPRRSAAPSSRRSGRALRAAAGRRRGRSPAARSRVTARTDAVRGACSSSDISPRNSPALRVASTMSRSPSRLVTSSSPERMM